MTIILAKRIQEKRRAKFTHLPKHTDEFSDEIKFKIISNKETAQNLPGISEAYESSSTSTD